LYMAERTGSLIFSVLWSYVKELVVLRIMTYNVMLLKPLGMRTQS
jgi:hypothetical protein